MLKRPGFTMVAVLMLTVGIALNTTIFSVVNAVLVRPLPYHKPETIFTVWQNNTRESIPKDRLSPANFLDWRSRNSSFQHLAAIRPWEIEIQRDEGSEIVETSLVTQGFFEILGVGPILGRTFTADEFERGARPAIVISYGLWQRMFGADTGVVGRVVRVADQDLTIVGVMPQGFTYPDKNREAWGPFVPPPGVARQRASRYLSVIGRPRPGVTLMQVRSDLERVASHLAQEYPRENAGVGATVVPLPDHVADDTVRRPLMILMFSVTVLLVVACLNVATFMLVRGSQRMQEFAVRMALGAGRWRLFRQLLVEAATIAFVGCAIGLVVSRWTSTLVPRFSPVDFPRLDEVSIDLNVVLFTVGIAIVSSLVFAAVPAVQVLSSRRNLAALGRFGVSVSSVGLRVRQAIVVAQVALALVLLVGAGLLTRSLINLMTVDPGFSRHNILATDLQIWSRFPQPADQTQFFKDLTERISVIPGVQAAGAASALPFIGEPSIDIPTMYRVDDSTDRTLTPQAFLTMVTPDYFRAMTIPLIEGRFFTDQDGPAAAPVAVVTEGIARKHWKNGSPIGRRISVRDNDRNPSGDQMFTMEIVGVVGDVQHTSLDSPRRDEIFVPHQQRPFGSLTVVTRTEFDPASIADVVRAEVLKLNPRQSIGIVATVQDLIGRTLVTPRFYLILIGAFAAAALLLAVIGMYGVISLSTIQRTREIGVRISLGALSTDILSLILRQGLTLTGAGIMFGLVASLAVSRFLDTLLFRVGTTDAITLAGVSSLLCAVATLACYLPARRATRIDPVAALRFE